MHESKPVLNLKSTLGDLTLYEAYIESGQPGAEVVNLFQANPMLPGIIITDRGQFVGMISRRRFFEYMSRPFSLELFSKRPLLALYQFAGTEILILNSDTEILAAVRQSLQRSPELIYEPIVVQVEGVCKLIDVHQLLLAQLQIHEMTTAALQRSEVQLKEQTTQLQQTLHELQHTQAKLIQTEKMSGLGQMVAGVAHEINNPVSFIYGNLTYAARYTSDLLHLLDLYKQHYPQPVPEIGEALENIDLDFLKEDLPNLLSSMQVGADRICQIVLSLRNFSRLDEAQMKRVNIHEGIDSALLILQNRLHSQSHPTREREAKHSRIIVNKEYGNLPPVECYVGQLNQVFMNLLNNAIDALEMRTLSSPIPTILIRTEVIDSERIAIRIADNGCGMTQEILHKSFDPFFTTKPVGKGTGLGLSIAYHIVVEKHGGQLKCDSVLGQGTEFVIEIPIQQHSFASARSCA